MSPKRKSAAARLEDLVSVGPATVRDLNLLGIRTVQQLVGRNARALYQQLSDLTGVRQDPCVEDVFNAAIAQAQDPALPPEQRNWWYYSRLRKARAKN